MTQETAQLLISVTVISVITNLAVFTTMVILIWMENSQ
jgi:hypothetical protein